MIRYWNEFGGVAVGKGGGGAWTPTSISSKLLYWGKISEISEGHMPNKVGTDYITVGGSAGSYTFQVPNTEEYVNADTEYLWVSVTGVYNDVTEASLIAYDFSRTFVYYDTDSPNTIREILILKAGEALTDAEYNALHTCFKLSVWHSGVLNLNGEFKSNRTTAKNTYVSDAADYLTLVNRMIAEGEEPSADRKTLIYNTISALKTANVWEKLEVLYILAAHGEKSSLMNWISNTYDATKVLSPTFTTDRGWSGDTSNYLSTGLNLRNLTKYLYNDASMGGYLRLDGVGRLFEMSTGPSSATIIANTGNYCTVYLNSPGLTQVYNYITQKGSYCASRLAGSDNQNIYLRGAKTSASRAAYSLKPDGIVKMCYGVNGMCYGWIGAGLTDGEEQSIREILIDSYLTTIGAKV